MYCNRCPYIFLPTVVCIVVCIVFVLAHIDIEYIQYEPNTCQYKWYVLNTYLLGLNACQYVFNT